MARKTFPAFLPRAQHAILVSGKRSTLMVSKQLHLVHLPSEKRQSRMTTAIVWSTLILQMPNRPSVLSYKDPQWWPREGFLPVTSFGLRVLSLPASVCPCVFINHGLAQTITHHLFKLVSPKFGVLEQKIPIVLGVDRPWPSRSNLTSKYKSIPFWTFLQDNLSLVQARINKFGPEMLQLRSVLILGFINIQLQLYF